MGPFDWKRILETWWRWPWLRRGGLGVVGILALGIALLPGWTLARSLNQQELGICRRDLARVVQGVENELETLYELARDWGRWDEAYQFVRDGNQRFARTNLSWEALLTATRVQLIYFFDPEGRGVWGGFRPQGGAPDEPLSPFTPEGLRTNPLLNPEARPERERMATLATPYGVLLLSSHPVLPSSGQAPSRGTLIMGRLLDSRLLARLTSRLNMAFQLESLSTPPPNTSPMEIVERLPERLVVRTHQPDMLGTGAVRIQIQSDRAMYLKGMALIRWLTATLVAAMASLVGMLYGTQRLHTRTLREHQATLETLVAQRTHALQASETRLRAFTDHTSDLLFWCGVEPTGAILLEGLNPAAAAFKVPSHANLIGRPFEDAVPPAFAKVLLSHLHAARQKGSSIISEDRVVLDSGPRHFQTLVVPIRGETGQVRWVVGSCRDVTTLREQEDALMQTQRLESLGVLAGGIAHDFNNLLTAAAGNLEIVLGFLPEDTEGAPFAANVSNALAKAANLTRQLLAYSGRGRFLIQVHDLNAAVREKTALLDITIRKKARIEYDLAESLPALEADGSQLQQVIMNLVTNASEALGDNPGAVRIATRCETLRPEDLPPCVVPLEEAGTYVVLEVSDTGCGMTAEQMTRIFEPFYTTKKAGRGLGLSAMLGILRSHRGGLALVSAPGAGTTFTLYFPTCDEAALAPSPSPKPGSVDRLQGTVLVVDDEETILRATSTLLTQRGLKVHTALDGLLAMEQVFTHREAIQAVVLDLTMPNMDGREFLEAFRPIAPTTPVIITSGFTVSEIIGMESDPNLSFLQKPYQTADLIQALARVLPGE